MLRRFTALAVAGLAGVALTLGGAFPAATAEEQPVKPTSPEDAYPNGPVQRPTVDPPCLKDQIYVVDKQGLVFQSPDTINDDPAGPGNKFKQVMIKDTPNAVSLSGYNFDIAVVSLNGINYHFGIAAANGNGNIRWVNEQTGQSKNITVNYPPSVSGVSGSANSLSRSGNDTLLVGFSRSTNIYSLSIKDLISPDKVSVQAKLVTDENLVIRNLERSDGTSLKIKGAGGDFIDDGKGGLWFLVDVYVPGSSTQTTQHIMHLDTPVEGKYKTASLGARIVYNDDRTTGFGLTISDGNFYVAANDKKVYELVKNPSENDSPVNTIETKVYGYSDWPLYGAGSPQEARIECTKVITKVEYQDVTDGNPKVIRSPKEQPAVKGELLTFIGPDSAATNDCQNCIWEVITPEDKLAGYFGSPDKKIRVARSLGDYKELRADGKTHVVQLKRVKPELKVEKKAEVVNGEQEGDSVFAVPGSTVKWIVTIKNTGDVALTDLNLTDNPPGRSLDSSDCNEKLKGQLQLEATVECTLTEEIGQDLVESLLQKSQAPTAPLGNEVTVDANYNGFKVSGSANATVTVNGAASLKLEKSISNKDSSPFGQGDQITYEFKITNTGKVTLHEIAVKDPKIPNVSCPDPDAGLEPGASKTCKGVYQVKAEDFNEGNTTFTNTATVTALQPGQDGTLESYPPIEATAEVVAKIGEPKLTLKKEISKITSAGTEIPGADLESHKLVVGDIIEYKFTVANDGTVRAENVKLSDEDLKELGGELRCEGYDGLLNDGITLAAGESVECTGSFTLSQKQIDEAGFDAVVNEASVSGNINGNSLDSVSASATVGVKQEDNLELLKFVEDMKDIYVEGDEVVFKFNVTNKGTRTVKNLRIVDGDLEVNCDVETLAPGDTTTCQSNSVAITEQNVAEKSLTNTATASASLPDGGKITSDTSSVTINTGKSALAVEKTASVTPADAPVRKGSEISWTITIKNTGATPIEGVTVLDENLSNANIQLDCKGQTEVLAGESFTCTATQVVTQEMVDAGKAIENIVKVTGSFHDKPIEAEASASVPVSNKTGLSLIKKIVEPKEKYRVGDELQFQFEVENTGDVTLKDLKVNDPFLEEAKIDVTCTETELLPGAKTTCEATKPYKITAADARDGKLKNVAIAQASNPSASLPTDGQVSSPEAEVSVEVERPYSPITPTDPNKPIDPADPVNPEQPIGPAKPADPSKPSDGNGSVGSKGTEQLSQTGTTSSTVLAFAMTLVLAGLALIGTQSRRSRER